MSHNNRSGEIGTAAESAVVKVLRTNGFGQAERRRLRGGYDQGDITGTPGIVWEVKGGEAARKASDRLIESWLDETEHERVNADAKVGVLIVARKYRPTELWWAILRLGELHDAFAPNLTQIPARLYLSDALILLRQHGWGDSLDVAAS